jgi:hypothetical protein
VTAVLVMLAVFVLVAVLDDLNQRPRTGGKNVKRSTQVTPTRGTREPARTVDAKPKER